MLPAPIIPRVFFERPTPILLVLSFQFPFRTSLSLIINLLAIANIIVKAATATGLLTALGVLVTTIPFSFIADMSTESKPTPKREIILSLQSLFETVSKLAFGRLRSIASNCDAILDETSVIDLSIQKNSISFLTFNSSRGASPKQGLFSLLSKSPEIPTLNILGSP